MYCYNISSYISTFDNGIVLTQDEINNYVSVLQNNTENTGNNTDDSQIKEEENTGKDESKISENVEALTTSPHTGDMNIVALIALMIISLIGMVIIVKKK